MSPTLSEQLLTLCHASGVDVNHIVQAAVNVIMVSLIVVGPDAESAERNLRSITADMLADIHRSYAEYHAMVEAQQATRQ